MTENRVLIEEEQTQRIRTAALALEAELEQRGPADPDKPGTEKALTDVRLTLSRMGREAPYSERVTIENHLRRQKEKRA